MNRLLKRILVLILFALIPFYGFSRLTESAKTIKYQEIPSEQKNIPHVSPEYKKEPQPNKRDQNKQFKQQINKDDKSLYQDKLSQDNDSNINISQRQDGENLFLKRALEYYERSQGHLNFSITLFQIAIAIFAISGTYLGLKYYINIKKIESLRTKLDKNSIIVDEIIKRAKATIDSIPDTKPEEELDEKATKEDFEKKEEAFSLLESLREPLGSEYYYKKGNSLSRQGEYANAIINFDRAIQIDSNHYKAWTNKGIAFAKLGFKEEAIKAYRMAIKINQYDYRAYTSLGNALDHLGRFSEAQEAYDEAIRIRPDFSWAWYNKAVTYSFKKKRAETLEALNKALIIDLRLKNRIKSNPAFSWLGNDHDFNKLIK